MGKKTKLAGLVAILALSCFAAAQQGKAAKLQGKMAPKLQTEQWLNSQPLALNKLKGKVVVLDFWAHW